MMELMIENDLLYLLHLEKEIEKMEDQLIKSVPDNFFTVLTKYRQKLSELDAYYEQLAMIGDLLQSQDGLTIIHIQNRGIVMHSGQNDCITMCICLEKIYCSYVNCINLSRMHNRIKLCVY